MRWRDWHIVISSVLGWRSDGDGGVIMAGTVGIWLQWGLYWRWGDGDDDGRWHS